MTDTQHKAILRKGLQSGKPVVLYIVSSNKDKAEHTVSNDLVAERGIITHDTTTVKNVAVGNFPNSMEIKRRITNDIAETVVNRIQSLSRTERMDADGLLEILSQGIANLKNAGVLAPAEHAPAKPLPEVAPKSWIKDRGTKENPDENPPEFIRRVYGEWLNKGLSRATIFQLDKPLYASLTNFLRHHQLPSDMKLPTIKELNDQRIEAMRSVFTAPNGTEHFEEVGRLSGALRSRDKRSRNRD